MEKVTVVIPNFDGMKFLPECIESLRPENQRAMVDYEVLVIDNGSTDGSVEYLRSCGWVRSIFLDSNTGFCHAVNLGIKKSKSPYVILLNNDTKAYTGFVQGLYSAISKRKKCFSVSAQMLMWDDEMLLDDAGDLYCCLGWSRSRGKGKPAEDFNKPCKVFSACGGAAIYRRSVFEKIGYFDELHFAYLEDLDIGYRAKLFGYYNRYEPTARVLHYGSASTGSRYNTRKTELSSANNVYVIAKNMPIWQIILNFIPLLAGFITKFVFFCKKGMGLQYARGFVEGWKRALSEEGKAHKVKLGFKNIGPLFKIQGELWMNLIPIIKDGN